MDKIIIFLKDYKTRLLINRAYIIKKNFRNKIMRLSQGLNKMIMIRKI